jgi:hypothetical protein
MQESLETPDPSKFNPATDEFTVNIEGVLTDPSTTSYNWHTANLIRNQGMSNLGYILKSLRNDQVCTLMQIADKISVLDSKSDDFKSIVMFTMLCMQAEGHCMLESNLAINLPLVVVGITVESLARKGLVEVDYSKFSLDSNESFCKVKE